MSVAYHSHDFSLEDWKAEADVTLTLPSITPDTTRLAPLTHPHDSVGINCNYSDHKSMASSPPAASCQASSTHNDSNNNRSHDLDARVQHRGHIGADKDESGTQAATNHFHEKWDSFYTNHTTGRVYKPRNYLCVEFFDHLQSPSLVAVVEVGCGHGCSMVPIVADPRFSFPLYIATDYSTEALKILNARQVGSPGSVSEPDSGSEPGPGPANTGTGDLAADSRANSKWVAMQWDVSCPVPVPLFELLRGIMACSLESFSENAMVSTDTLDSVGSSTGRLSGSSCNQVRPHPINTSHYGSTTAMSSINTQHSPATAHSGQSAESLLITKHCHSSLPKQPYVSAESVNVSSPPDSRFAPSSLAVLCVFTLSAVHPSQHVACLRHMRDLLLLNPQCQSSSSAGQEGTTGTSDGLEEDTSLDFGRGVEIASRSGGRSSSSSSSSSSGGSGSGRGECMKGSHGCISGGSSGCSGVILFRDYGVCDMTMYRHHTRHSERLFVRSDGTLAYYFDLDYLRSIAAAAELRVEELEYATVRLQNRKTGQVMRRVFVHAVLRANAPAPAPVAVMKMENDL